MKRQNLLKFSLMILIALLTLNSCEELLGFIDEEGGDGDGNVQVYGLDASYQNGNVILTWGFNQDVYGYDIFFSEDEYGQYDSIDTVYNGTEYTHNYSFQSERYYYYKLRPFGHDNNYGQDSHSVFVYISDNNGGGGSQTGDQMIQLNYFSDFEVQAGDEKWYYIDVSPGDNVDIELDDINSGYMSYDGNVQISIYHPDKATMYTDRYNIDNTNNQDTSVVIPEGEFKLYIKVTASNTGWFGIKPTVVTLNNEARLSYISVHDDNGEIGFNFSQEEFDYDFILNETVTTLTFNDINGLDPSASVSVTIDNVDIYVDNGSFSVLNFSMYVTKEIIIKVISSDGTVENNYTFTATTKGSNGDMSNIILSDGSLDIPFNIDVNTYTINVPANIEQLSITPVAVDSYAIITVNSVSVSSGTASSLFTPEFGENTNAFIISISPPNENGSMNYYFNVVKELSGEFELDMDDAVTMSYDELSSTYSVSTVTGAGAIQVNVDPIDPTANVTIDGAPGYSAFITLGDDYEEITSTIIVTPNNGNGTPETFYIKITPSWIADSPMDSTVLMYAFNATINNNYLIQWDDLINGSGKFGEDVFVTAFREDQFTPITGLENVNSAFDIPITITAPASETIYLEVRALDGSIVDDFAIRVQDVITGDWVTFKASGNNTIIVR